MAAVDWLLRVDPTGVQMRLRGVALTGLGRSVMQNTGAHAPARCNSGIACEGRQRELAADCQPDGEG